MNASEREKLTRFLQQLAQAQAGAKDAEAEKLIGEAARAQPDAPYLLVQRSLLLEQALENAQAEITGLKRALETSRGASGSFLDNNAWGTAAGQTSAAPRFAAPAAPVPAPAGAAFPGAGFLGTVASTAAGVLAGSFLFQGIGHLLGNQGNASGFLPGGNAQATPPNALAENFPADKLGDPDSLGGDPDLAALGDSDLDVI